MARKLVSSILILGTVLFSACSDSTPAEPRPPQARLDLSLASSTVDLGQRALITLTLPNDGDGPLPLSFSTSCQVDLVVERAGVEVWSLLSRTLCAAAITDFTLQPGQSVQYPLSWNQSRNDGGPPQPGTFTVRGILQTADRLQSEPATLTVRP